MANFAKNQVNKKSTLWRISVQNSKKKHLDPQTKQFICLKLLYSNHEKNCTSLFMWRRPVHRLR